MAKLDALIADLLFAHIAENAPDDAQVSEEPEEDDPDAIQLAETQASIRKLRMGYAAVPKTVSDETMFTVLPQLEATERDLKAKLRKKVKARMGHRGTRASKDPGHRSTPHSTGTRDQGTTTPAAGPAMPRPGLVQPAKLPNEGKSILLSS
jgi:hypothetical protein